jgi:acyl carrier protein
MSGSEEIYGKVARVLVEALNVDEHDLTSEARLQGDLGAESIEFLDIVFRLEREFGIKVPRGELFPDSIFQGNTDFVSEGRVTDKCMEEVRRRMPYAELGAFDRDRQMVSVPDLFTVDLVTHYIAWNLGQRADTPVHEYEPCHRIKRNWQARNSRTHLEHDDRRRRREARKTRTRPSPCSRRFWEKCRSIARTVEFGSPSTLRTCVHSGKLAE